MFVHQNLGSENQSILNELFFSFYDENARFTVGLLMYFLSNYYMTVEIFGAYGALMRSRWDHQGFVQHCGK